MDPTAGTGNPNIRGFPAHGGRYIQYNVCGNLFEVSRKYLPPIRPIGRGAYGLVWYLYSSSVLFPFSLVLAGVGSFYSSDINF